MNKKGFTLVELLAVIVILAIIALISTPIILGVIETAKKGAAEQSALGYIDAVEKQIVYNQVKENQTEIVDKTYTVEELQKLGVNVKGTVPRGDNDIIIIDKGKVKSATLTVGDYNVEVDDTGKATVTKIGAKEEKYTVYANGTAVYYNPETNKKCSESEANKNVNENGTPTGIKTGCMKWYTFNDEEGKATVNMILDHNTTATVVWNSTGNNKSGPKELLTQLKSDTDKWSGVTTRNDTYSINGYTINYNGYKARLITANEVANIVNLNSFDETTMSKQYLNFETGNSTSPDTFVGKYKWLYEYTYKCKNDSINYGCELEDNYLYNSNNIYGYWTVSSVYNDSLLAWRVGRASSMHADLDIRSGSYYGVRPVIEISKDTLK